MDGLLKNLTPAVFSQLQSESSRDTGLSSAPTSALLAAHMDWETKGNRYWFRGYNAMRTIWTPSINSFREAIQHPLSSCVQSTTLMNLRETPDCPSPTIAIPSALLAVPRDLEIIGNWDWFRGYNEDNLNSLVNSFRSFRTFTPHICVAKFWVLLPSH